MENNLVKLEPCPFCGCRDRRVGIRRMGNNGYIEVRKSRTSCISEGLERAEGACTERGKRKME